MVTSRTFRDRFETLLIYCGLALFALIAILPFLNTIARSFSAEAPIIRGEVYVWPVSATVDAYRRLFLGGVFWRAYWNSYFITAVGTAVQMVMTLLLFYIVEDWNMFLPAIFFINDGSKQPIQVILRDLIWSLQLQTQTASADQFQRMAGVEALKAASVLMAAIPMLVFYPFIQRYFIRGIMLGAVKA